MNTVTFHHYNEVKFRKTGPRGKRRQSTEATVGFSRQTSDVELRAMLERFYTTESDEYVQINFAKARKNPKDAPNRKLAKELVKERMESAPVSLSFRISSVNVSASKVKINLSLSDGDNLKAGLAGVQKFNMMTLVIFKTSGRMRLEKYESYDDGAL